MMMMTPWGRGPHHLHEEHADVEVGVLLDVLDDAGLHELPAALHQQAGRGDAGQLVALQVPQPPGQDLKDERDRRKRLSQTQFSGSAPSFSAKGGKPKGWPATRESQIRQLLRGGGRKNGAGWALCPPGLLGSRFWVSPPVCSPPLTSMAVRCRTGLMPWGTM